MHTPLHHEYQSRLPSWVLMLSDRLSMANGVEVRVPFMDRALLDLASRLDPDVLIRGASSQRRTSARRRSGRPASSTRPR